MNITKHLIITALSLLFMSCEGVFDFVYDKSEDVKPMAGQLYFDASAWNKWYYVDLDAIADSLSKDSTYDGSRSVVSMDIPKQPTGDTLTVNGHGMTGQYMYWYDILGGGGLKVNKFKYFFPTAEQPEPEHWTFAVHRDNVRTNGGAAWDTGLTDISRVTRDMLGRATFTEDEFSENEVWDDNSSMLQELVPSQGIKTNRVLSSWLVMSVPPIPPSFEHCNHVFVIRTKEGRYVALQLYDYIGPKNKKCCMTIKYRFVV